MSADHSSDLLPLQSLLSSNSSAPLCYFSIPPALTATHFSLETPSTSPLSEYSTCTPADPCNPLLALRALALEHMSSPNEASRLLQLQTQAGHRPTADPLQHRGSTSSANSDTSASSQSNSGLMSPRSLCCCRCRREYLSGMYQFGTNLYYCSHCARMTGYSAG